MKAMNIKDIIGFDFLDKPKPETIKNSIQILQSLAALDDKEKITELGREMS